MLRPDIPAASRCMEARGAVMIALGLLEVATRLILCSGGVYYRSGRPNE